MKIYEYKRGLRLDIKDSLVALGFFDGVHAGHRRLLATAKRMAEENGLLFAVFTFRAEKDFKGKSLYSTEDKLELLESLGVEAVILADFSDVSSISAEDFVRNSLVVDMDCRAAVAGFDFRFGSGARGNAELLSALLAESGALCKIEAEHKIGGEKISTTKIKELLAEGDPEGAAEFLGAPYFIKTVVAHGDGRGRTLGFPTVNTEIFESPLASGVYRTAILVSGKLYSAVTNVGTCPTFGERTRHAETYIIDYSGDLYGEAVRIFLLGYLREEKRFKSSKELIMQINVDKNRAIKENGDLLWLETGLK